MGYIDKGGYKAKYLCCGYLPEMSEEEFDTFPEADVVPVIYSQWEECDYVEPCVHGFGTIRTHNAGLKCKHCAHVFKKELLWKDNYCPNCGAKMNLNKQGMWKNIFPGVCGFIVNTRSAFRRLVLEILG